MDLDPDPTQDPTPFFSDFKDAKKKNSYFFLKTYPQAHYLQHKKFNFLLKFCVEILICKHYYSLLSTFMRKGKDPEPDLRCPKHVDPTGLDP